MIKQIFVLLVFVSLTANFLEVIAYEQKIQLEIPPEPDTSESAWNPPNVNQGAIVTSYLWTDCDWKSELVKYGITWQKFNHLYSQVSIYFVDWIRGYISWDLAVTYLIDWIENYIENPY